MWDWLVAEGAPGVPGSARWRWGFTAARPDGASSPPYEAFNLGDHVGDAPAAVAANRDALAADLGVAEDAVHFMTQVHGFDPVSAGHAASIMAAAMIAGAFIYGWLESRTGRAKAIVAWGTLLTALGFAALALSGQQSHLTAVALFSLVGAAGFTYAILMAHARQFFPEHLIGRGMTFVNFLFIAGAGALQSVSGWFIAEQRASGLDAATTFANLHWAFAALLLASVAIYALSPARPKR